MKFNKLQEQYRALERHYRPEVLHEKLAGVRVRDFDVLRELEERTGFSPADLRAIALNEAQVATFKGAQFTNKMRAAFKGPPVGGGRPARRNAALMQFAWDWARGATHAPNKNLRVAQQRFGANVADLDAALALLARTKEPELAARARGLSDRLRDAVCFTDRAALTSTLGELAQLNKTHPSPFSGPISSDAARLLEKLPAMYAWKHMADALGLGSGIFSDSIPSTEERANGAAFVAEHVKDNPELSPEARRLLTNLAHEGVGPWSVKDNVKGVSETTDRITVQSSGGKSHFYLGGSPREATAPPAQYAG
ncbi:MAG: hypothetical protein IT384_04115 [Deltaproteobacteria bacterium]|nr:hypothetical protein [Deltaproteobacteria bacterium]